MAVVKDVAAERAILAGICQHGSDLFLDVADLVKTNSFAVDSNKVLFKCLEHICGRDEQDVVIDLPSILSAAKELHLDHIVERKDEAKHLNSILSLRVDPKNVRRFAGRSVSWRLRGSSMTRVVSCRIRWVMLTGPRRSPNY